jgi:Tfp pilus assembly protein FimT
MGNQSGTTILELCAVILILSILAILSIPSFTQFLMREERAMVLERLTAAIEYAKQEAFVRNNTITVCGSINHRTCVSDDWSAGFLVIEANKVLYVFPRLQHGNLHFDRFGTNVNIEPDGTTRNNGTFTYCPKKGNKDDRRREAAALVINNSSRTYRPIQRNSAGIFLKNVNTPEEEPLSCR